MRALYPLTKFPTPSLTVNGWFIDKKGRNRCHGVKKSPFVTGTSFVTGQKETRSTPTTDVFTTPEGPSPRPNHSSPSSPSWRGWGWRTTDLTSTLPTLRDLEVGSRKEKEGDRGVIGWSSVKRKSFSFTDELSTTLSTMTKGTLSRSQLRERSGVDYLYFWLGIIRKRWNDRHMIHIRYIIEFI